MNEKSYKEILMKRAKEIYLTKMGIEPDEHELYISMELLGFNQLLKDCDTIKKVMQLPEFKAEINHGGNENKRKKLTI